MLEHLDLRGTPCPVNFVRCRLALEKLKIGNILEVDLDRGEPEEMVLSGLRKEGHQINIIHKESDWIRFTIASNDS